MLQNGTILNDTYLIEKELGKGGGGVVYKARHLRLNIDVVVKQIHDSLRGKVKSRQEADVLKQLKHPFLPRVYDFIETAEGVYTVMDFIPGKGLDEFLRQYGRFEQKLVMKWAIQLGEALAYLHSRKPGIIHSDIKPANIIITPQGNVCLIDFNISVVLDASTKTSIGVSVGYSPPEQYRDVRMYQQITKIPNLQNTQTEKFFSQFCDASSQHKVMVDMRSDIYSLGCVLYHALTGHVPDVNFDRIVPMEQSGAVISEGLRLIVEKMMQMYPDQRYQNGTEYLDAIKNCYKLDHRYLAMRRKEKLVAIASAVFLVAGAGLTGLGIRQQQIMVDRTYANAILEADECMAEGDADEALDAVVYYLYSSGSYEDCLTRIDRIFADQIPDESTKNTQEILGDIYYIKANANYELENYSQAIADIEQAIECNDSRSVYYRDYCLFLAKDGNLSKAENVLDVAKEYDLGDDSLLFLEAELAYANQDYDQAREQTEQLLGHALDDETKRRAIMLCLDAYTALGDYEGEIARIEELTDSSLSYQKFVLLQYEAQAYLALAEQDESKESAYQDAALQIFQKLKEDGYDTFQINENIAILYENQRELKKAEQQLLQMQEDYPGDYRVYKRLAFLEADKQQEKENRERDYAQMKDYYDQAEELYAQQKKQDAEMQLLETKMQNVIDGGWLD
jgi:serine/threonine-protein kinase